MGADNSRQGLAFPREPPQISCLLFALVLEILFVAKVDRALNGAKMNSGISEQNNLTPPFCTYRETLLLALCDQAA